MSDPALCRSVLDQLLRQTVISRLRLAHTEAATQAVPAAANGQPGHKAPAASASLVTRLSLRLRRGGQAEIDSLANAIIQKHGLDEFFATIAPKVDAMLRRQAKAAEGESHETPLGQWRLQELLQRLTPRFRDAKPAVPHGRRVLLVSPEPEQHGLDLRISAECFSRDGWDVFYEQQTLAELIEVVQREWFAMLMIAVDDTRAAGIAGMIRTLRRAACNPDIKVLVMNEGLAHRPDRLARLGADAAAANISLACAQSRRLFALLPVQL